MEKAISKSRKGIDIIDGRGCMIVYSQKLRYAISDGTRFTLARLGFSVKITSELRSDVCDYLRYS